MAGPHIVEAGALRSWLGAPGALARHVTGITHSGADLTALQATLGVPLHVAFTVHGLLEEDREATVDSLASIPFYSLCRGLFLPLSSMAPERAAGLFGIAVPPPPATAEREVLLQDFLGRDLGLSLVHKLSCVLGDPFRGGPGRFRRDSLIRVLQSMQLSTRRELLDRLTVVGDVSVLFAESRHELRGDPALTSVEVLDTLRMLARRGVKRTLQFELVRSLLARCGKLEAYFLARLILRKAGFGFDYQGGVLARMLGEHHGAPPEQVAHAMALTDAFHVAGVLADEGPAGLRKIQLQPLVPVRPALASGTTGGLDRFPVWVERKYDGIRFMLHKSTDARGAMLCGAYTRNRRDWLELVPGLDAAIRMLPVRTAILDGELYGTVVDLDGARPATVYELYSNLQGNKARPVNIKFAAFDVLYIDGTDLTGQPLRMRRQWLQTLLAPLQAAPLPVPLEVAQGHLAESAADINRLYAHFRAQGYEGLISKDLEGPYLLAARDPTWLKRKPEITLDLVLLGAVFAVTEKKTAGTFGSYVIGARTPEGGFADVGDVAGVDTVRDAQIRGEMMREGLITGQRIERQSASGTRPGMDLRPHIVVTVRFEGIVKEGVAGELRLRAPKLVAIRADKTAAEANTLKDIEQLWLRQRVG